MATTTNLGLCLRLYRQRKDLSVRQVAPGIGISHATLSRIERGYPTDQATFLKILNWLVQSDSWPEASR